VTVSVAPENVTRGAPGRPPDVKLDESSGDSNVALLAFSGAA